MTNEELTSKYMEIDERVTRHTEQIKTAFNRIDDVRGIADSVYKLATTVEILTREQKISNEKLDRVSEDVEEIKNKPAKRWETVVSHILTAVIAGLVAFVLAKLGLS